MFLVFGFMFLVGSLARMLSGSALDRSFGDGRFGLGSVVRLLGGRSFGLGSVVRLLGGRSFGFLAYSCAGADFDLAIDCQEQFQLLRLVERLDLLVDFVIDVILQCDGSNESGGCILLIRTVSLLIDIPAILVMFFSLDCVNRRSWR